jgi:ABC-type dipeptide/oligopeptide/nickel transport system permease subunit
VFIPSIAIFLTVLALNYMGDVIRTRFDVRESAL